MSFALAPQVPEAFAPFAAEAAAAAPPPVGDVAARRATLEGVFGHYDAAQPFPGDVTVTDHELTTADGARIRLRWSVRDGSLAPLTVWSWDDNRTGWQALLGDAAGGPDTPAHAAAGTRGRS
ncbi:hypothetical protein GCM10023085_43740 [Actinomadura viridis]|uniref:Uncharacterized protein n=1 Tax=Actinomadura viridis TaxID=58110 RepID=A0A931GNP1_9ACTN|nr:hypothetical protein [Actinomadura viridis]MBG6089736.1 hypothetical protein [Actinomadura viridis]